MPKSASGTNDEAIWLSWFPKYFGFRLLLRKLQINQTAKHAVRREVRPTSESPSSAVCLSNNKEMIASWKWRVGMRNRMERQKRRTANKGPGLGAGHQGRSSPIRSPRLGYGAEYGYVGYKGYMVYMGVRVMSSQGY